MRNKRIFILLGLFLSGCYTNTSVQLPIPSNIKPSNSVLLNPTTTPIPIVLVTSLPQNTPSSISTDKEIQSSLKNDTKPTPIPTFLPTNIQPLPEPSNYGIPCTSADFSNLPKNNLNDVYKPEDYKSDIMTFLKLTGEIYISLGFKNEYKIRQLSLLTKKEEDKFTFVSQSCFDTTKLNQIIKNDSIIAIYDDLGERSVESIEIQEDSYRDEMIREGILSRLSRYTLIIKAEPTEEGYNKVNDSLLKLREIGVFKYISPNQIGTVS